MHLMTVPCFRILHIATPLALKFFSSTTVRHSSETQTFVSTVTAVGPYNFMLNKSFCFQYFVMIIRSDHDELSYGISAMKLMSFEEEGSIDKDGHLKEKEQAEEYKS